MATKFVLLQHCSASTTQQIPLALLLNVNLYSIKFVSN